MESVRYKAFISYSHQDERWGRWLQKALESYRVPRRLAGSEGRFGPIPARLTPVFRDREDFSTAADLTASVTAELAAAETLVVICSPAAARSRWVDEEIRYFQELGRGDRILALIVDGDPQSADPEQQCFPPALARNTDGTPREPLAADARPWADGKLLARLKLVAGILGIRLDDLRRRDMQRRQRLWVISTSGALTVALVTTVLAVVAVNARHQAENRREHAENLVGYMVGDLRRKLDEVGRLDLLEGVGGKVSDYLATLDPREVTDESLDQQAMVWRQLGEVSMDQGKLDEAMSAFQGSREVLGELQRRKPLDPKRIYQLGNAEFWVAYVHLEKGEFEAAREALDRYLAHASQLVELEPDNPEWLMEQSYAQGNIAALIIRQKSTEVERALEKIEAAVELNRRVIELAPDNVGYVSEYGEALAWQADTQLLLCDLGGALKSRQENVAITRELMQGDRGNANLQRRHAYALSGLADVAQQIGLIAYAAENFEESVRILGQLIVNDPTNVDLRWERLKREFILADLQAGTGDISGALDRLADIYPPMLGIIESEAEANIRRKRSWISFLLGYSDIAWRGDDSVLAEELRERAVGQLGAWLEAGENLDAWQDELISVKFLIWHQTSSSQPGGAESLTSAPQTALLPDARLDPERRHMSCADRSALARQALLEGDLDQARAQTEYLQSQGYFEPHFVSFCRAYELCHLEPGGDLPPEVATPAAPGPAFEAQRESQPPVDQ